MPTIDSPAEAQSLAQLIQQGRITGAARDTAMQALRGYDASGATPPQAPNPNAPQGALGELALAGRDVGEGVLDTLAAPHDLSNAITNWARPKINQALGTHLPQAPYFSGQLSDALTSAGAPVATTPGEKLTSSIIKGGAGALTGAGVLGLSASALSTVPNALRAGAAGMTGGGSADLARQAGAGPVGQFAAGLLGGFTPNALEGGLNVAGGFVRPFTRSGQAQLAANTLYREASNPTQAAVNLGNASPLVPGSLRTTGEASGDTGLLSLEKGVRARNPGPFGSRISQQNAARQAELAQLGGTPADIAAAEKARDTATAPMRQAAFANAKPLAPATPPPAPAPSPILNQNGTPFARPAPAAPTGPSIAPVHATIDSILDSPAGAREAIGKTMRWAKGLIGDNTDPETLYEVRKDLALAQQDRLQPTGRDAPNVSMLAQARGQLGQVIRSLDDTIESAAPGYKAYLARYSDLSEPVNQMEAIQGLQQKASNGLDTSTGHPFLSAPQFSRQLGNTLDRSSRPFPLRMTADQTRRLEAVREDLQRGNALSSPTVRTPGSDTFQNFMTGQRIGGGLVGHIPFVGKYLRGVNDFVDQRVNEQLAQAMLDPSRAAALLLRGKLPQNLRSAFVGAARRGALPAAIGPLAALPTPSFAQPLPGLMSPQIYGRP
jgi:hypothetical protein